MKTLIRTIAVILLAWGFLTIIAQRQRDGERKNFGSPEAQYFATILYNPDPFYNLDQQVSEAFAAAIAGDDWQVEVMPVAQADRVNMRLVNLFVFCSNTYNWAPDKQITNYIKAQDLSDKKVVAITLGSGSTERAKRILEETITNQGGDLIGSEKYWLLRPNDENSKLKNVEVAKEQVMEFAKTVVK